MEPAAADLHRVSLLAPTGGASTASSLDAALGRLVAEGAVDAAVADRRRERWRRQLAADEATFADVVATLAERGDVVVVSVPGDDLVVQLDVVGQGWFAAHDGEGRRHLVALDAVDALRVAPGQRRLDAAATHVEVLAMAWNEAIAALVEPRAEVRVRAGERVLHGVVREVGADVLALDGGPETPATFVPFGAITTLRSDA